MPGAMHRSRSSGAMTGERSTSPRSRASVSSSWGDSWRSAARPPCAPAGSVVSWPTPISNRPGSYAALTSGSTSTGMSDLVGRATQPIPTELTEVPTELDLRSFSAVIWATGFRPSVQLAGSGCARPPRPRRSRRRSSRPARPLPVGAPFPATSSFQPTGGIGQRRCRTLSAPRQLPGGHGAGAHQASCWGRPQLAPMSARRVRKTISSTGRVAPAASSSPARSAPIASTSSVRVANTRSCRVVDIGATPSIACVSIAPSSSTGELAPDRFDPGRSHSATTCATAVTSLRRGTRPRPCRPDPRTRPPAPLGRRVARSPR